MREANGGKRFDEGKFVGEVMTKLDHIQEGIERCHKGLDALREDFQTHCLEDAKATGGSPRMTTGISASVAGAVVGVKMLYDWLRGG